MRWKMKVKRCENFHIFYFLIINLSSLQRQCCWISLFNHFSKMMIHFHASQWLKNPLKPLKNHNVTAEDEIIIKLINEMNYILLTVPVVSSTCCSGNDWKCVAKVVELWQSERALTTYLAKVLNFKIMRLKIETNS